MTTHRTIEEARAKLGDLVQAAALGHRTVVTKNGVPKAVLVSIDDARALDREDEINVRAARDYERTGPTNLLRWDEVKGALLGVKKPRGVPPANRGKRRKAAPKAPDARAPKGRKRDR